MRSLGVAALAALGMACGGGPAVPAGTPDGQGCYWELNASGLTPGITQTGVTSADLTGLPIRTVSRAFQPELRKKIAVTVTNKPADLQLGDGYLIRDPLFGDIAEFLQPATNVGTVPMCQVLLTSVAWATAAGGKPDLSFDSVRLLGSVGITSSGSSTSCLFPGEAGFLIGGPRSEPVDGRPFDEIASLSFTFGLDGIASSPGTVPTQRLVPNSYDVGTCDTFRALRVNVTNVGDDTALLATTSIGTMVLLADDGLPAGTILLKGARIVSVRPHAAATYVPFALEAYDGLTHAIVFANYTASR